MRAHVLIMLCLFAVQTRPSLADTFTYDAAHSSGCKLDRSDPGQAGGIVYQLQCDGEIRWRIPHDLRISDYLVSPQSKSVITISSGKRSSKRDGKSDHGILAVRVIAADGQLVQSIEYARSRPRVLAPGFIPNYGGMLVDRDAGKVIVRLRSIRNPGGKDEFLVFSYSRLILQHRIVVDSDYRVAEPSGWPVHIVGIRGTPLLAFSYWEYTKRQFNPENGARMCAKQKHRVIDEDGLAVYESGPHMSSEICIDFQDVSRPPVPDIVLQPRVESAANDELSIEIPSGEKKTFRFYREEDKWRTSPVQES